MKSTKYFYDPKNAAYGTAPDWKSWAKRRDVVLRQDQMKHESESLVHELARPSGDIFDGGKHLVPQDHHLLRWRKLRPNWKIFV